MNQYQFYRVERRNFVDEEIEESGNKAGAFWGSLVNIFFEEERYSRYLNRKIHSDS